MKKFLLLTILSLAVVSCWKEESNNDVHVTFQVLMSGSATNCFSRSHTIVDFKGHRYDGVVNEKFDAGGELVFSKAFDCNLPTIRAV